MELAHDLGGRDGLGAPEVETDEPIFHEPWERTARALVYAAMASHPNPTTSAFRHAIERMDPEHYLASSYYEHWLTAAATVAVESGVVERSELEAAAGGTFPLSRPSVDPHVEASGAQRFAVGDRVRVVAADHGGHSRCPGYVRGRAGTVVRVDGRFSLPDVEAHSTRRVVEGTYGVRFAARDLWDDADELAVVHVDLWDSYLEPA
ncbi:MAG: nitrile hydratase subunit beta [Actinobacteria bacterium]|nr:nitrile hydratase subunit beta [Actinomycetota bacterium]